MDGCGQRGCSFENLAAHVGPGLVRTTCSKFQLRCFKDNTITKIMNKQKTDTDWNIFWLVFPYNTNSRLDLSYPLVGLDGLDSRNREYTIFWYSELFKTSLGCIRPILYYSYVPVVLVIFNRRSSFFKHKLMSLSKFNLKHFIRTTVNISSMR